jgi:salicylate hydroxylase
MRISSGSTDTRNTRKTIHHGKRSLCVLNAGHKGWEIVRRDHFLENLVKLVPEDPVHLRHRVDHIEQPDDDGKVELTFSDGNTAYADAGK